MLPKPEHCYSCVGYHWPPRGHGFVPADGTGRNGVLLVFEAAGEQEAREGRPLIGRAGLAFQQLLQRGRMVREDFRIHNVLSCRPPNNKLRGMPYEEEAIAHCKTFLDHTLQEKHWECVVAGGEVALRALLPRVEGSLSQCRGYVFQDAQGRWVVPTFHPSHIARGQTHLAAVFIHDLQRACEIARDGYHEVDLSHFLLDPPVVEAWRWLERYEASDNQWWLSVDIETPRKRPDEEEQDELEGTEPILRCGYAYGGGKAVMTLPWGGSYETIHRHLLASSRDKVMWNAPFDAGRLAAESYTVGGTGHDGMIAWHVLNGDLPKRLGFVAPFYCPGLPMWKHLARERPDFYNACDVYATDCIMFGQQQ